MTVNDRGTKKWSAMMLTEHQEALTKLFSEEEPMEEPILSEDQATEINFMLNRAVSDNLTVAVTYFEDGGYSKTQGKVSTIHYVDRTIKINDSKISLHAVVDAEII